MFSLEKVLLSSAYYYRPKPQDQQEFSDPGTYSFVVPAGVEKISAVAVGAGGGGSNSANGGGGGGGALQYRNNMTVTPGETLTVTVGRGGTAGTIGQTGTASSIYRGGTALVYASGGSGAVSSSGGIGGAASSNSSVPIPYAPVGNSALDSVSGVLSLIVGTNVDDTFYEINLPFNISFLGVSYNRIYIGSNAYITFAAGSSMYSGFTPSNPPGPHVLIYPADRRLFQLYTGRLNAGTSNDKFVIRQQGGDYANPNRVNVWEAHFYPNQNYFDIFFITDPGNNAIRPGISNGTTYLTRYDSVAGSGIRITTLDPTLTNIGGFTGGNGGTGRGGGAGGGGGASGYTEAGGSGGGQGLISVIGSVFAQSSDYNGTRDPNNSYISINGTRINYGFGRGHTVAVINPSTLGLESIRTYDTYGQGSDPLYSALVAIPDGKVVVIASFDATSFYSDVRNYVNTVFRCSRSETWSSIRRSHIIIGIKNTTTFPVEVIQDSTAGITGTFSVAGPTRFESGAASTGGGGGGGNAAAFRPRGGGGVGIQGISNNGNSNGGGGSSYNAVTSATTAALNSQIDFYPVSLDYAWSNFMNNYAVWSPNGNGDYYRAFYAPIAGVYTIEYAADNYLAFYVDGSLVATTTDFGSSAVVRTTLTIGTKRLRFIVANYGGPAGWAVTIRDPNGTLVWDTRTYRLANSVNNFVRIAAGGTASSGQIGGQYGGGGGGGSAGDPPLDYNEGATARTDRWDNATTYLMSNVSGLGQVLMHGYQPGTRFTFTYNNLPGHNQVRYQVYWHFVDSVDNEYCELTINSEIFAQFRKYLSSNGFSLESSRMATATWVPASYSYAPWPGATVDGYIVFDTGWINHTASTFTAGHYNGLNQAQSDEATYISHVRFQTRTDASSPGANFEAGPGGNGGVRIIWGASRTYPYQAQDVTPVRIGSVLQLILHYDAGNLDSYRGGSTVYDISGNSNTGTITYGFQPTTIQYYGNIGVLRFPAWTNTKLDFNANELTNTTITVEMWALVDDFAGGMFFGFNIHDVWTTGGTLGFNTGMGDVYGISAARINALNIRDRWTHYTFVMNVGNYNRNKIYINGVEESLSQQYSYQNTSRTEFNSGVGRIGGWLLDTNYQQVMDLAIFKIYNRGLTPLEITTLYNEQRARFSSQLAQTGLLLHLDAGDPSSYPRTTIYTGNISYSLGAGGAGGVDANNGSNGGSSTLTFNGVTLTSNGGTGGGYNNNVDALGGSATGGSANAQGGSGGVGNGRSGDLGGGGGGGINGGAVSGFADPRAGATGGNAVDFQGLSAALVGSGFSLGSGGAGGSTSNSPQNGVNGSSASGVGAGGGGAGWYGGNGGNGTYGGGGGGAAGYTASNMIGGTGGSGLLVLRFNDTTTVVLTSSTSYSVPASTTSIKAWLIGGGGGGAGSTASDGTAGGGGGAGGIVYYSWEGGPPTWYDISGNNNHFNFRGNSVTFRGANGGNIDLNNDLGSGIFDSYLIGPDEPFRIRADITVEIWFKLDARPNVNDWVRIIGKSNPEGSPPSNGRTFGLWYHWGASVFLWQRYGSGYVNAQLSRTVEVGRWYHMVGVSLGNAHTLYIDGVAVSSQTAAVTADTSTDGMRIGGATFHTLHNGPVAVARLWNRGFTSSEITGLYSENRSRYISPYSLGLYARKYSGYFADNVNYFASNDVTEAQVASQIANWSSGQDYYSWEFRGFFRAPATGNYWFQIYSDDASYMWVLNTATTGFGVGNAFINHGGLHGPSWSGRHSVNLTAGTYMPVRIQFGENAGQDLITVAITTDSGAWEGTSYGAGYYFHDDATRNHT